MSKSVKMQAQVLKCLGWTTGRIIFEHKGCKSEPIMRRYVQKVVYVHFHEWYLINTHSPSAWTGKSHVWAFSAHIWTRKSTHNYFCFPFLLLFFLKMVSWRYLEDVLFPSSHSDKLNMLFWTATKFVFVPAPQACADLYHCGRSC